MKKNNQILPNWFLALWGVLAAAGTLIGVWSTVKFSKIGERLIKKYEKWLDDMM